MLPQILRPSLCYAQVWLHDPKSELQLRIPLLLLGLVWVTAFWRGNPHEALLSMLPPGLCLTDCSTVQKFSHYGELLLYLHWWNIFFFYVRPLAKEICYVSRQILSLSFSIFDKGDIFYMSLNRTWDIWYVILSNAAHLNQFKGNYCDSIFVLKLWITNILDQYNIKS